MSKLRDGSVVSSYFKTGNSPTGDDIYNQGMVFVPGQIEKVHFVDDQSNVSKSFVEYDVSIRDEKGGQSVIRNVRYVALFGGSNDFDEQVLEPNEFAFSGRLDNTNLFKNKNGTFVLVAFMHGSKDKPFIAACLPHSKRKGAKRKDGIRKLGEFRGVEWNINKDGELIITQRSSRSPKGELKANDKVNTEIKLDKEGNFSLTDREQNKIYLDRENKKIVISQKDTNKIELDQPTPKMTTTIGTAGLKVEVDGAADKVTTTTAGGLNAVLDGQGDKVTYTTAGGPKVEIDGSGMITLTANSTIIKIDGNSGKIELTGQLVDVGEAASALAALGPQLVAWLQTHTHMVPQAPTGQLPSQPPIVPPPASVLSTTVKIKP